MPTDVVMPQMGESIAEGTIVRWIKKVGDTVERDEPLFEISTDKVDAEIPSPAAGVVAEIRVKEGETVGVNTIVAVIGEAGVASAPRPPAPPRCGTFGPRHRRCRRRRQLSLHPRRSPPPPPMRPTCRRQHRRPGSDRLRLCGELPRNTTSTSRAFRARVSPAVSASRTFSDS